jgi:arabinogalactan endo-1,4-beta-galactosidase
MSAERINKPRVISELVKQGHSYTDSNEIFDLAVHAGDEGVERMRNIALTASSNENYLVIMRLIVVTLRQQAAQIAKELKDNGVSVLLDFHQYEIADDPEFATMSPQDVVQSAEMAISMFDLVMKAIDGLGYSRVERKYVRHVFLEHAAKNRSK